MDLYSRAEEKTVGFPVAAPLWRSIPFQGLLVDWQIKALAQTGMIRDFVDHQVSEVNGEKVVSFGLSSCGYDVRCVPQWKTFISKEAEGWKCCEPPLDPKKVKAEDVTTYDDFFIDIPPAGFVLTATKEYFKLPRDVFGIVQAKSTYARCGINCHVTPLEPGWEGQITLEFSNLSDRYVRMYANEGVAQVMFFRLNAEPEVTYDQRHGKYQGQTGITLPRMK